MDHEWDQWNHTRISLGILFSQYPTLGCSCITLRGVACDEIPKIFKVPLMRQEILEYLSLAKFAMHDNNILVILIET